MKIFTALMALFVLSVTLPVRAQAQGVDDQQAVLVTGASTGIGRNMAETLAREGFFVYAGARKQADIDALSAVDNMLGVRLDVNIQADIDRAVELIEAEGRGLFELVNNAGVGVFGPLIEIDEEDFHFQMNVNVYGPYRVTKAFAPLLIASKGRITTTGSISGILSGPMLGAYSMSKHAMEAYTDALAAEMRKFDVHVSIIEPGNYRSAIIDSIFRRAEQRDQSVEGSLYREELERLSASFQGDGYDQRYVKEPDEVSAALVDFLRDANPKRRYMVVPNQRSAEVTIRKAISELTQINERHQYTYSRDELVTMLDEALHALEASQ